MSICPLDTEPAFAAAIGAILPRYDIFAAVRAMAQYFLLYPEQILLLFTDGMIGGNQLTNHILDGTHKHIGRFFTFGYQYQIVFPLRRHMR